MPEKDGRYLVTSSSSFFKNNIISIENYTNNLYKVDEYDFHDKKGKSGFYYYNSEYGCGTLDDVIAWQQLPESYKE